MVTGPAPVRTWSSSQRFPVSTLNNTSGDSKLIRAGEALRDFHALEKSESVWDNGRTSSTTVFITPPGYIVQKICHQPIDTCKCIRRFCLFEAPVIGPCPCRCHSGPRTG